MLVQHPVGVQEITVQRRGGPLGRRGVGGLLPSLDEEDRPVRRERVGVGHLGTPTPAQGEEGISALDGPYMEEDAVEGQPVHRSQELARVLFLRLPVPALETQVSPFGARAPKRGVCAHGPQRHVEARPLRLQGGAAREALGPVPQERPLSALAAGAAARPQRVDDPVGTPGRNGVEGGRVGGLQGRGAAQLPAGPVAEAVQKEEQNRIPGHRLR